MQLLSLAHRIVDAGGNVILKVPAPTAFRSQRVARNDLPGDPPLHSVSRGALEHDPR